MQEATLLNYNKKISFCPPHTPWSTIWVHLSLVNLIFLRYNINQPKEKGYLKVVEIKIEYSDSVKREAIKQLMFDIKKIVEESLGIKTVLYLRDPEFVEYIMTSPAYYYLKEVIREAEEYRTWFGLGSKHTRVITSEGNQVFGFAFGNQTTIRFEIFDPKTLEPITEIAKPFSNKYGFDEVMIQRQYKD
ncbi:MAG: hypothetical protein WCV58_02645 [Patescibacteria group bacterium]|jgi:hypothetical protein